MMQRRTPIALLALALVFALGSIAQAAPESTTPRPRVRRTPINMQIPLKDRLCALPGSTNFMRNGKLHVAVKSGEASHNELLRQPNTVEFFVKKGYMHLFVRVKGVNFDRHTTVKATPWEKFGYKDIEQSGVLLELPKDLYKQFVKHLSAAKRKPQETVGTFTMEGGKFPEQSNCTSWVTLAKMGDKRLVEALGIPRDAKGIGDANPTRHPQSWVNALIDHSPFTKAVIMRNHEKTSAEEAKIDFTVGSRVLVR